QADVLRLLRVDAQPTEMLNAVLPGALRLDFRELPEIIAKALHRAAVKPRPKRRLAQRHAPHPRQRVIVVGDPRHHVNMWVDVVHGNSSVVSCPSSVVEASSRRD